MTNVIDLKACAEARQERVRNAAMTRFGRWNSWTDAEVGYLLEELVKGHWHEIETSETGSTLSYGALNIAVAAHEPKIDDKATQIILNGVWLAADYLASCSEVSDPKLTAAVEALRKATLRISGFNE